MSEVKNTLSREVFSKEIDLLNGRFDGPIGPAKEEYYRVLSAQLEEDDFCAASRLLFNLWMGSDGFPPPAAFVEAAHEALANKALLCTGRVHHLKTLPEYFEAVAGLEKQFEVRNDDRDFQVGDHLVLQEWAESYTGRELTALVDYKLGGEAVQGFGLQAGYCVMGITVLTVTDENGDENGDYQEVNND